MIVGDVVLTRIDPNRDKGINVNVVSMLLAVFLKIWLRRRQCSVAVLCMKICNKSTCSTGIVRAKIPSKSRHAR
jgi:hypothetical protein